MINSVEEITQLLERIRGKRILVVGDLMADRYVRGSVHRISPEAPVPVIHVTEEDMRPGGAANVALNIQGLGGQAIVAGVTGCDTDGDELRQALEARRIATDGIVAREEITTTVKTRLIADRQQVARVDREGPAELTCAATAALIERTTSLLPGVDGVIIEDYGKGAIGQELVDALLTAADARGLPVGLDPKDNHSLRFSHLTLATPNFREACLAVGLPEAASHEAPDLDGKLLNVGNRLLDAWCVDLLFVTLGPHGMALFRKGMEPVQVPTRAREVFDVSGAGDTVIAAALTCLAAGSTPEAAMGLANAAAGVVVAKLGTAPCHADEVLSAIAAEEGDRA